MRQHIPGVKGIATQIINRFYHLLAAHALVIANTSLHVFFCLLTQMEMFDLIKSTIKVKVVRNN